MNAKRRNQRRNQGARKDAQLRVLVLRMQTMLAMRRLVRECFEPIVAAWIDVQLRQVGMGIVDEMRRIESATGKKPGAA